MTKSKKINNMKGGDGYAVNVFQPIAGRPSYIRYTDNCRPIFNGSLLQNGGSSYNDPTEPNPDGSANPMLNLIENSSGDIKGFNLKNYENFMVLNSSPSHVLNGGGDGPGCGCDGTSKNPLMNWLDQQTSMKGGSKNMKGGFVGTTGLEQFGAIQTLSKMLTPLGTSALAALIVMIFLHHSVKNKLKSKKTKMMGGAAGSLESILLPLGKNNLVVLGAILLLHHYAKKTIEKKKMFNGGSKKNKQSGGSITGVLTQVLAPLGVNTLGASLLLVAIRQAFVKKVNKSKTMKGGFSEQLTKMVKKVSAKDFQAKGLFKTIEDLFNAQMKKNSNNNKENDSLVKQKFDVLFNDIAPVTFSTFATKKSYKKADELKKFIVAKNQKKINKNKK